MQKKMEPCNISKWPNETPLECLLCLISTKKSCLYLREPKYNRYLVQSQCLQPIMTVSVQYWECMCSMWAVVASEKDANCSASEWESSEEQNHKQAHLQSRPELCGREWRKTKPPARLRQVLCKLFKRKSFMYKIEASNIAIRKLTGQVASLL